MNVLLGFFLAFLPLLVEDWISLWHFEANITPVFGVVYGALTKWHRLTLQKALSRITAGCVGLTEAGPDLSASAGDLKFGIRRTHQNVKGEMVHSSSASIIW